MHAELPILFPGKEYGKGYGSWDYTLMCQQNQKLIPEAIIN